VDTSSADHTNALLEAFLEHAIASPEHEEAEEDETKAEETEETQSTSSSSSSHSSSSSSLPLPLATDAVLAQSATQVDMCSRVSSYVCAWECVSSTFAIQVCPALVMHTTLRWLIVSRSMNTLLHTFSFCSNCFSCCMRMHFSLDDLFLCRSLALSYVSPSHIFLVSFSWLSS